MTFSRDIASNKAELFAALTQTSIAVPPRTEGRTTDHTETWTICRLLATLAENDRLSYPLSVLHRDRPDFTLTQGNSVTGIEVTEAVSQQYAAYCALAEREFPGTFLQPGHFRWGAPKMSLDEMRALLRQSQLTGRPWVGNRVEHEWATYIGSIVAAKSAKLAKPGYSVFPAMWLSVYDNLPLPNVNLALAISYLLPILAPLWLATPSFHMVYVEHGPVIAEIRSTGTTHLVLNDLWS